MKGAEFDPRQLSPVDLFLRRFLQTVRPTRGRKGDGYRSTPSVRCQHRFTTSEGAGRQPYTIRCKQAAGHAPGIHG